MNMPEKVAAQEPSLAQEWLHALRYWLGGRRSVIALAALAVVAGAALNWSWLVAAGIAPLLVAVLPCAVMCGLGLCLSKVAGGACSAKQGTAEDAAPSAQASPLAAVTEPRPDTCDPGLPALPTAAPGAVEDATQAQASGAGEGAVQPQPSDEEKIHA